MEIRTPNDLGHLIRDQRKARGWTQDALARKLDVSRLWVVQLEQGKATAQIGLVMRALNELETPIQVNVSVELQGHTRRAVQYTPARRRSAIDLDGIIQETSRPYKT